MQGTLVLLDPDPDLAALVRRVADETGLALRVAAPTDEDGVACTGITLSPEQVWQLVLSKRGVPGGYAAVR